MNCTFEQYLIDVGFRAALDTTYESAELINYIDYFRDNWKSNISAYIALTSLSFYIEEMNLITNQAENLIEDLDNLRT